MARTTWDSIEPYVFQQQYRAAQVHRQALLTLLSLLRSYCAVPHVWLQAAHALPVVCISVPGAALTAFLS